MGKKKSSLNNTAWAVVLLYGFNPGQAYDTSIALFEEKSDAKKMLDLTYDSLSPDERKTVGFTLIECEVHKKGEV